MIIKNLTPHEINLIPQSGEDQMTSYPSVGVARLSVTTEHVKIEDGSIPFTRTVFGDPIGFPEPEEGVYLIVSQIIKSALPQRADLVVPAEVVRDNEGRIIGCRSFGL